MRRTLFGVMAIAVLASGGINAGDWPSWRGPSQNGVSVESGLISDWSPEGKNLVWHSEFIGRSTPVVQGGQACVIGRVGEGVDKQEIVACFDAETGAKRWENRFNVYNTTVPFNRVGWASLVADSETGNIYAHGVAGQLICYDKDGKILWSRFLAEEVGRLSGYGGRTQTPLIDGDQLILTFVNHGWGKLAGPRHRYFSFDKHTGEILWFATPGKFPYDMNTQSAPVIAEIGGQRLLISGNADGRIYAMQAATGELVWSFALSKRGINSTVLVDGDRLFASHSEENLDDATMGRLVAIDATGKGDVTKTHELWRINEMAAGFPSPTYKDGVLYVVDNSANLHGIDAANGEIRWVYPLGTVGKASPVLADGKIFVPETNGRFHILKDTPEGPEKLSMHELKADSDRYAEIYGSAAIAYGRVYLSTEGGLYCLGDKSKSFSTGGRAKPAKQPKGSGAVAWIRVSPADSIVEPGETLSLTAHGFDASGRSLGPVKVKWSLDGLAGKLAKGKFTADPAKPFQAGSITATAGELTGSAQLRVLGPLPWEEQFESYKIDSVPRHWVAAGNNYKVREKDGQQVLTKVFRTRGLLRNALYMGPSTLSNYTIEADLMGGQKKRRRSDIGLIAAGYTLDLMGNHQRLQIRTWPSEERMAKAVDFPWEMDTWYRMKLQVDTSGETGKIRGKVWKKGESEPDSWTIEAEDPLPIPGGSPGLIGYSPVDIHYDNIKVTVNP